MKKILLIGLPFILMSFGPFGKKCGGAKVEGLSACLDYKDQAVAIIVHQDEVSVGLYKDKNKIASVGGLGYDVKDLVINGKKKSAGFFKVDSRDILVLRTSGDNLSMVFFFEIKDNKFVTIPVKNGEYADEGVGSSYSSIVKVSDGGVVTVHDDRYFLKYKLNGNQLERVESREN